MTQHTHPRDVEGRFLPIPRCTTLNRYIRDPQFRAQMDALRVHEQMRLQIEMDRMALANFKGDPETGWVSVMRDRVAEWEAVNG